MIVFLRRPAALCGELSGNSEILLQFFRTSSENSETLRQFCRERGILLVHHIIPLSPSRIFQPLTAEITRRNPDTE